MKIIHCLFFLLFTIKATSQDKSNPVIYNISSAHNAFPDSARKNGHTYNGTLFNAADHYADSSVLIVIPASFKPSKKVNLVCWFHGWYNTIDSANKRFELATQFAASNANAILLIPEGAKNAPDSYGGKLEQSDVFKKLVDDVMQFLIDKKAVSTKSRPANILLAGHSGAYRVMANILVKGGLPVNEVLLFDGLYSETDKYLDWIGQNKQHRFINIYTNDGGTAEETMLMEKQMDSIGLVYQPIEEEQLSRTLLSTQNIIIVHSNQLHNDIINQPDHFKLLLGNSPFLK
jgi:hypothetical protein